jgi:hypothetical protein
MRNSLRALYLVALLSLFSISPSQAQTQKSIADARSEFRNGSTPEVILEGTVTRAFGSYARMQDDSGPTGASGITIRQTEGPNSSDFQDAIANGDIQPGTQLRIQGTLSDFSGLIQLNNDDLVSFTVISQGDPPTPQDVTLSELTGPDGEDYESELVRVTNLNIDPAGDNNFAAGGSEGNYDASDGTATLTFRVPGSEESAVGGEPIPAGPITFTDVVGQFNSFQGPTVDTGYQLIAIQPSTALPVELTSFTVETDAQQAVLTWTTATETNNAGFEVQHQAPGAASWSQIGFEQGAGTTTEARSYRFATDALQPGVHTFRLRQVDTDGTESFSDTRRVEIAAAQAVAFAGPNPVSAGDRPRVTVQLDRAQDVTIRVYNVLGQQVDQLYRGVLPAAEVLETSVSTANLPSGMYFLRVQGPSVNEVKKFTVVK